MILRSECTAGSCSPLSCEDTAYNAGEGMEEKVSILTLSGNTYYVNVGHYDSWSDEMEAAFIISPKVYGQLLR